MTLGAWLRLLVGLGDSTSFFYMIVVGQAVAAISQPLLVSAPSKLAASWFPANQVLPFTLACLRYHSWKRFLWVWSHNSLCIAPYLHLRRRRDQEQWEERRISLSGSPVSHYNDSVRFGSSFLPRSASLSSKVLPSFVFSPAAILSRPPMARSIPVLLRNCNYLTLAASFAFFWASILVLGVILSQLTSKFDYTSVVAFYLREITPSLEQLSCF